MFARLGIRMSRLHAIRSKALCTLLLTLAVSLASATETGHIDLGIAPATRHVEFTADQVWLPEVEQLEWSSVRPETIDREWLAEGFDLQNRYVVVRGVANTLESAVDHSIEEILPRLDINLDSWWKRYVVGRRVRRELKQSTLVEDQFSQTFVREGGGEQHEVFTREAMLLDLSGDNLHDLRRAAVRDLHRASSVRKKTFSVASVAIAVTLLITWLGARFLNAVTQGYYVWPVRFASVAVLLVSFGLTAGFMISMLRSM